MQNFRFLSKMKPFRSCLYSILQKQMLTCNLKVKISDVSVLIYSPIENETDFYG